MMMVMMKKLTTFHYQAYHGDFWKLGFFMIVLLLLVLVVVVVVLLLLLLVPLKNPTA